MSAIQNPAFPILTYHSIDGSGSVISTRPDKFRRQMRFLNDANFNVITLKTLIKHLRENLYLPPQTVVLTFDDGYQNFYTDAFPILEEFNFVATVFLVTGFCGKYNDWSYNLPNKDPKQLLSWNKIIELSKYNIEFAAHTRTHPNLVKLSQKEVEQEMVMSKLVIEERLGLDVTNFAYPFGQFNLSVKHLAQKHFKTACSTRLGIMKSDQDFFELQRLDTYFLSNERFFRATLSLELEWYMSLRQIIRDLREKIYNPF